MNTMVILTIAVRDDLVARVYEGSDSFDTYYLHHDPRGESDLVRLGEHYIVLRQHADGTVDFERGVHREDLPPAALIVDEGGAWEKDAHGGENVTFLS